MRAPTRGRGALSRVTTLQLRLFLVLALGAAVGGGHALGAEPLAAQLSLIESHYQAGERFRTESEVLRFLHDAPDHPAAPDAALLRAKLYFQEGRHGESALMLHALLDRYPAAPVTPQAERLLGLARVMEGQIEPAAQALARAGAERGEIVSLGALLRPAPDAPDPGTAVAWSTVIPGAGFFVVDQPGKAFTAMGLNLALIAGTVIAYQQENTGAALVLLLAELALYTGGRGAVRDAAEAAAARMERQRRAEWVQEHGAPELLRVGFSLKFDGP